MTPHVFLGFVLILVGCCCCTVSRGELLDCCLSASSKELERKRPLVDYRHQVAGFGCSIDAVVFVCRSGVELCMAPDAHKVRQAMRRVDRLKRFCRDNDYEAKRCLGVKRK
ncbi:C-C motif chemokine 21-like [Festucalex cinctus]